MKNCDRRPRAAFSRPRSQFFTIRTDPKPVNNLFIFFLRTKNCFNFCKHADKNLTKALPWPVGRYRRILPALTTNQNAGFVTVPSENKIMCFMLAHASCYFNSLSLFYVARDVYATVGNLNCNLYVSGL